MRIFDEFLTSSENFSACTLMEQLIETVWWEVDIFKILAQLALEVMCEIGVIVNFCH